MKLKSYIIFGLSALTLAACDDSFDDWANPISNAQDTQVSFGKGSVKAVDLIDFANVTEGTDSVQVCAITAPTTSDPKYTTTYQIILENSKTYNISANGKMAYADLKSYVESVYGKRPTERDLSSIVRATVSNGATATRFEAPVVVKTQPVAPIIEEAYYYVGATNSWSSTDQTYKLSNGGGDVYANPVFTAIIKAPYETDKSKENYGQRVDNWFKIAPASAYTLSSFWDDCKSFVCATVNGASDLKGKLVLSDKNGGAWNMPATDGAKYYKMSFNMLDQTYEIAPLNFEKYLYMAGNCNGWHQVDFLSGDNYDGNYTGYMYLGADGFKFCSRADWTGTNYGAGSTDGTLSTTGDNIIINKAAFYRVDLSLIANTYTLTEITTIGLIGDATPGGWNTSTPMTYNTTDRCWEITATVTNGTFKFRANDGWTYNWGGDMSNLTQDGANINISAGTYNIKFYPYCSGKSYCTVTPVTSAKGFKGMFQN